MEGGRLCKKPFLILSPSALLHQGDLILFTDHVIELVLKLSLYADKMELVKIDASGTLYHNMPNGTVGTITVQHG